MSRRGALAALLLLLLGAGGCRHPAPAPLPPDVAAQLGAAAPGSHLTGRIAGLSVLSVLDRKDFTYALAWGPASDAVAFSHLGFHAFQLALWRVADAAPTPVSDERVNALDFEVEGLAFSPDGALLAAASRSGRVHLYAAQDGRELARAQLDGPLVSVAFHPQGQVLVAGGANGRLTVLDVPALRVVGSAQGHGQEEVRALAFAADGTLYSGGWDRHVRAWALGAAGLEARAAFAVEAFVNDLSVDARGERLAVALSRPRAERTPEVYLRERKGVREPLAAHNATLLLEARSGRVLQRWVRHAGVVATAGISPDGRSVASGGWDQQLYVFREGEEAPRAQETFGFSVRRVRFSPDGRLLGVAAWTPQNMAQESDPAAVLYRVHYADVRLAQ